jgi:hypothetical protein
MKFNKESFLMLVTERDSKTIKKVKWRIRNRWWIRIVQMIHLEFLILRDKILNK